MTVGDGHVPCSDSRSHAWRARVPTEADCRRTHHADSGILTKCRQHLYPPTLCELSLERSTVMSSRQRVLEQLDKRGGYLWYRDLLAERIDPHVLRPLVDEGTVERIRRGLYRRVDSAAASDSLAAVTTAAPEGVICLLSALDYYGLTTTTPSDVYLAIPRKARPPRIEYPPVRVVRYGERIFRFGVTNAKTPTGQVVPIYNREKTIADAFHFADIVGRDVAIEVFKTYLRQPDRDIDGLLKAAEVCRVAPLVSTYLEALQ